MFDLDDLSPAGPSGSARPSPCWVLPGGVHSAPWERLGNRCRARMDRDGFLEFDERNYEIMENHGNQRLKTSYFTHSNGDLLLANPPFSR